MEAIAERLLQLEIAGSEKPSPVHALIGKPEQSNDYGWITPYEIHGPGPDDVRRAHACGADAVQSLALALFVLPHELKTRIAPRGRLTFEGDTDLSFGVRSAT